MEVKGCKKMSEEVFSESVWFNQVDTALLKFITSIFDKEEVYTFVRKPDEDYKIEKYPCISIYNIGYTRNPLRYNPMESRVGRREDIPYMYLEKSAIPYDLEYQLDFWSVYQSDMNDLTRKWLGKFPDGYINLPVLDASSNERNSFMRQKGSIKKSDKIGRAHV